LNEKQKAARYSFHFLTPEDYEQFFQALRDGVCSKFKSTLHTALAQ
jgi:hypothetical protein